MKHWYFTSLHISPMFSAEAIWHLLCPVPRSLSLYSFDQFCRPSFHLKTGQNYTGQPDAFTSRCSLCVPSGHFQLFSADVVSLSVHSDSCRAFLQTYLFDFILTVVVADGRQRLSLPPFTFSSLNPVGFFLVVFFLKFVSEDIQYMIFFSWSPSFIAWSFALFE